MFFWHPALSLSVSTLTCQINGVDTVRVPVSVVPYEDRFMKRQRLLESVEQDDQDASESADTVEASVKTVSEASENAVSPVDNASISEEGTERSENTSGSSEAPKQDWSNSE